MAASTPQRSFGLRLNLFTLALARHWGRIALVFLGIYVAMPVLAPTLMHLGIEGPGRVLYAIYSPFCHQFAFRSFFLYGEQSVYPLEDAANGVIPFDIYAANSTEFSAIYSRYFEQYNGYVPETLTSADLREFTPWLQLASREFLGDAQMGYKMPLCERDMSIYLAMFVGGIIYTVWLRRWLRPVPLWLYILLGVAPIGIDGFSQMLGYPPFNLWTPRETVPAFRVLTGTLFGLMNVWLAFPYLEMSMRDTCRAIEQKLAQAGVPIPQRRRS